MTADYDPRDKIKRTAAKQARMQQRTGELINRFSENVRAFESVQTEPGVQARLFTGPSLYFHQKTIRILREIGSGSKAVVDERFIESLYATLTSWGLHRMGSGGAKLIDYGEFSKRLARNRSRIGGLEPYRIELLEEDQIIETSCLLWDLVQDISASETRTQLVAGTKTLHHILPELIPPIDSEYTLTFFYNTKSTGVEPERDWLAFVYELYPALCRIARDSKMPRLSAKPQLMRTSKTKLIDNAIVGWGLRNAK